MKKLATHQSRMYFICCSMLCLLLTSTELCSQSGWRKVLDASCFSFCANPLNPRTIYAGGGARAVYRSDDEGKTWDTIYVEFRGSGEEFLNIVVSPRDTNIVLIGGSRFGTIRRSTDRGNNWDVVLPPTTPHTFNGESIIVDKSNADNVFAADFNTGVIYRSSNQGSTWDSISILPIDSSKSKPFQNQPCSITQRGDSTNIFYTGCLRSNIFRSEDYGKTWRLVTKLRSTKIDDPEIPQIHFSSSNPLVGYAITSYFYYVSRPNGGVFKTIDGGQTWQEFMFRDTAFWTMTTRPLASGVGDEIVFGGFTEYFEGDSIVPGSKQLLRSRDNGKTWWNYVDRIPWGDNIDNSVFSLRYVGETFATQKLYAACVSGLYVLDADGLADAEDVSINGLTATDMVDVSVNHSEVMVHANLNFAPTSGSLRCQLFDQLGREMASSEMLRTTHGFEANLDLRHFQTGVYFAQISSASSLLTKAFLLHR